MPDILADATSDIELSEEACSFLGSPHYGCVYNGDLYFNERLGGATWLASTATRKEQALVEATMLIDRLNISGEKATEEQRLQFPRGTDEAVPTDIQYATYEIAEKLLAGFDIDMELSSLRVTSRSYGSVGTAYDPRFQLEYLSSGIPSWKAWAYLKAYLRDPNRVRLQKC